MTKSFDIAIKVWRRDVQIISETETSIKVCCNYRLKNNPRWKPIYCWISKKSILEKRELKGKKVLKNE